MVAAIFVYIYKMQFVYLTSPSNTVDCRKEHEKDVRVFIRKGANKQVWTRTKVGNIELTGGESYH